MPWPSRADAAAWWRGLRRGDRRAILLIGAAVMIGAPGHLLLERRSNALLAVVLVVVGLCGAAGWVRGQDEPPR